MNSVDRLIRSLSSEGKELKNIKFFLGDDRNITQEQLCDAASDALKQVSRGLVPAQTSVDKDINVLSIEEFLTK